MTMFRFLHISDLHIAKTAERVGVLDLAGTGFDIDLLDQRARASSHSERMLRDLARLAWVEGERIEGVILTGDIATTGSNDDLNAAHGFLRARSGVATSYLTDHKKPTLNTARGLPVYLIPGNHDRFDGWFFMPGGTNFDKVFSSKWSVGQSACALHVLEKQGAHLAIIGGDLSLREVSDIEFLRIDQILGAGKAHQDVLDKMVDETNRVRSEHSTVGIIWLVHFPPKFPNNSKISKSLKLLDERKLISAAQGAEVTVLLCGHTHEERQYTIPGTSVEVYCAGSATQYLPPYSGEKRTVHFLEVTVSASGSCSVKPDTLVFSEENSVFEK